MAYDPEIQCVHCKHLFGRRDDHPWRVQVAHVTKKSHEKKCGRSTPRERAFWQANGYWPRPEDRNRKR